jgi:hypothetical protein
MTEEARRAKLFVCSECGRTGRGTDVFYTHRASGFSQEGGVRPPPLLSEKDVKLAQKLGQLQSFTADSHRNAWANLHILGQPNTFLALCSDCREHLASFRPALRYIW